MVRRNLFLFLRSFFWVRANLMVSDDYGMYFSLKESSVFTSKVKMCATHEGMELWTLFVPPGS